MTTGIIVQLTDNFITKMLKTTLFLAAAALLATQAHGMSWIVLPTTNPLNDSLVDLMSQINQMKNNLEILIRNNTFGNAVTTLQIAKQTVLRARDDILKNINVTISTNGSISISFNTSALQNQYNQTVANVIKDIQNLQNLFNRTISGQFDPNCTANLTQGTFDLMFNYVTNFTACPVINANKGLAMINADLEYLNLMTNLSTLIVINVNNCYSSSDTRRCLIDYIATTSKIIVEAPGKVAVMVLNAKFFIDFYVIYTSICFVDVSFNAQARVMQFGIDRIACMAKNIAG